jgi:hypothetical protein
MGSSFVSIDGKGFWSRDSILELFLRMLALQIEDPVEPTEPAAVIRNNLLLHSRGYFGGCVNAGLGDAVQLPGGAELVRKAIEALDKVLSNLNALDVGTLNALGFSGEFTQPVETWRLREMGHAWLALMDGRITAGPGGDYPMPGCGPAPIEDRPELA